MGSSNDARLEEAHLAERLRATLGNPLAAGSQAAPSVVVHIQGATVEDPWVRLESFLDLVAHRKQDVVLVGYFHSGAPPQAHQLFGATSTRFTLHPSTDWDWDVWSTRLQEAQKAYEVYRSWPNLLVSEAGGWVLESPSSELQSYLYPLVPIR